MSFAVMSFIIIFRFNDASAFHRGIQGRVFPNGLYHFLLQ